MPRLADYRTSKGVIQFPFKTFGVAICDVLSTHDVLKALRQYRNGEITQEVLLEWVNIVWFTELYNCADGQDGSIASVMAELEMLDEDDMFFSDEDYIRMIAALERNFEFNYSDETNKE